ncbi:patatin-like phospholipase family protein [Shewanella maritima]|uniref:patatin-like phospholipase family protein n=1 Tax=Shewanella maritima TaxID=2520507 RepID=UPI003735FA3B
MKKLNYPYTIYLFICFFLVACATPHKAEQRVSQAHYKQVVVPNFDKSNEPIRVFDTDSTQLFFDDVNNTTPIAVQGEQMYVLVLSGGGVNGAYGAGVINGLHESNQLPNYSIITGISAGALMAPFVFVGDENIKHMKQLILGIDDKSIIGKKHFLNTIFKDALSEGQHLYDLIEQHYSDELIDQISVMHQQGKRLLIGTTHFDSNELVVWNIGEIASSQVVNRYKLIRQIIAASASIPAVFPPQFIDVELNGETMEEMHVDGGLANQLFLFAEHIDFNAINSSLGLSTQPVVQVIRNGVLDMPYQKINDKGIDLITRTVKSMTVNQGEGDLYHIAYMCRQQNLAMRYTSIDQQNVPEKGSKDMFDQQYMQALFNMGYEKAVNGQLWQRL